MALHTLTACPVCGSTDIALDYVGKCNRWDDGKDWPMYTCNTCTLGFLNPQPDWETLATYYNQSYDPYAVDHTLSSLDDDIAAAREAGEFRHVRVTDGMRVLDVGCGGGAFLRVVKALGADVFGIEPSQHGAEAARSQGIDVFHGQLHEYLEKHGTSRRFDVITSNHVVEHHPQPVELLKQMAQLLAPGGYIWFSVPNASAPTARALKGKWHSTDLPYHLMQFTPDSLRAAVRLAGLNADKQYTFSLPEAVKNSLVAKWREQFFVPQRITQRLAMVERMAEKKAAVMDAEGIGEALIVQARPIADAVAA